MHLPYPPTLPRSSRMPQFWRDKSPQVVRFFLPILLASVVACLVYIGVETVSQVIRYYTPFPIWDYWRVVEDLPGMQSGHWGFLWRQHNEHRIVFPELVFAADMLLWHGRQVLPLLVTFLCYAGTWLVLSWSVLTDRSIQLLPRVFAACIAGCMVLWHTAALTLAVPFLLQWTFMQLGVACALVFLSRMRQRPGPFPFFGVALSAAVATYSSGNGLVLWPLLLGWAVVLRFNLKRLLILCLIAAATVGTYFIGYRSSGSLHAANLFRNPGHVVSFIASYLSMPFGGMGETEGRAGLIAGYLVLVVMCGCVGVSVWKGWFRDHRSVVLLGFMACNVLTALITAAGRMDPNDFTYGGAKALRYLAVPQMNWGVAILMALWLAARLSARHAFAPLLAAVAAALGIYLPKLDPWMAASAEPFSEDQLVTVSFENNLPDPELSFRYVYPDLQILEMLRARLEASQLSIYYHARSRWLGHPAARFAPVRPGISGAIAAAYPAGPGVQITGWADDSRLRLPFTRVVITDESGAIRGFGQRFLDGFPITASIPDFPGSLGWAAYIPPDLAGKKIFASIIDPRKFGLMPVATGFRVPHVAVANPKQAGPMLTGIDWTLNLETPDDHLPAGRPKGDLPSGPVHSTYGGSDAAAGVIRTSVFGRPKDGCLILPVFNGPTVNGLSARLEDAATGVILENLPLRDSRSEWHFWRVEVPSRSRMLRFVAQDDGRGWGQWVALANPMACQ